jgi:hypothetical protein
VRGRAVRERRHLAEEVARVEPADLERPSVPAHDQDAHAARGDEEDALPGVALADHDPARAHDEAAKPVRDAPEEVVLEIGEEGTRERLASPSRGPVPEAPDEGEQLPVQGQRVLLGRLRPDGPGRRARLGDVRVGLFLRVPAARLGCGEPSPRRARERLEAVPDIRAARGDRVGPPQRLESPVVKAVPCQLVRDADQDRQRLLATVGQDQKVGEAEALGEGRGAVLDLRAQDRGGLGVAPLRHELVDGGSPVRAGEPVGDHGRTAHSPTSAAWLSP